MLTEKEPESAPRPKPPQQSISTRAQDNPGGKRARMQQLLRENWENCDPKYWQFQPDHRYRFTADELLCMKEGEMTAKEAQVFYEVYDLCEKKMKAANLLRLPYNLAEWLIKSRERSVRADEEYEQWVEEEAEIGYIMAQLDEDQPPCQE